MKTDSRHRRFFAGLLACLAAMSLTACHGVQNASDATPGTVESSEQETTSEWFSNRDMKGDYDEDSCVKVALEGETAKCHGETVKISGGTVSITREGSYLLTGVLEKGMLVIEADEEAKVQLILDGARISNDDGAAIYVKSADKVFLTLAAGSENVLSDSGGYSAHDDDKVDGAVFAGCDLTVNGTGSLEVMAAEGHGIVSKDDLRITGGSLTVTAAGHGLSGKDSVRLAEGRLAVVSGKDGIHAEHEDEQKGYVYIANGSVAVVSQGDGISASGFLQIDNGSFAITAGGGSGQTADEGEETSSAKGIKAARTLVVNDGAFAIDARDDALHADGDLILRGGGFRLASKGKGIHGDRTVAIEGGTIEVSASHEGVEGYKVAVSGGCLRLCAEDDGINAAGGRDGSGSDDFADEEGTGGEEPSIQISGGEISIDAAGDGIDSNGSLIVSGGKVYVSGPVDDLNGALDYDGEARITGGTLVAAGSSGMAMNFGDASTQGTILIYIPPQNPGTEIVLKDSQGRELAAYTAPKAFSSVVVSCPELEQGGVYTMLAGDSETEVVLEELRYGKSYNETE